MTFSFNLIDQPWIPCLTMTGEYIECSLYELITEAHNLREIHCETSLMSAAMLPMVLALLHRVYGPKSRDQWLDLWQAGKFPPDKLETYFEQWYLRFDLFDNNYPFFQAYDERVQPKSLIHLIHSIGNTGTLFTHASDEVGTVLSPATTAQYLLAAQAFRTAGLSGLKEKFTDGPLTRGVLFFAIADTLYQTLMLNLMPYPRASVMPHTSNDRPFWERDDPFDRRTIPDGYLDYLTWPNIRIKFIPEQVENAVMVSEVTIAPGLTLSQDVQAPHKRYMKKKDSDDSSFLYFNENKALWRDYHSLLALDSEDVQPPAFIEWLAELALDGVLDDMPLQVTATGMLANQAKPIFYRNDRLPLPVNLLRDSHSMRLVTEAINTAEDVELRLKFAVQDLAHSVLTRGTDREPDKKDIKSLIDQWDVTSFYWQDIEPIFWQFVEQVVVDSYEALSSWHDVLREQSSKAFSQAAKMAGAEPWVLKGQVQAERKLHGALRKILEQDNS